MARTANEWFALYGESHTNPTNKLIHFIFVPTIMFTVLGLFWAIPMPAAFAQWGIPTVDGNPGAAPLLNAATVFMLFALVFYARASLALMLGMVLVSLTMIAGIALMHKVLGYHNGYLALTMFGIFAVSWVFQFWGHKIEGAKPSFLQDLQFLLVGPMWILGFLYRKAGLKY